MSRIKAYGIVLVITGALLFLIPIALFPVCVRKPDAHMLCADTQAAVCLFGAAAAVNGALCACLKTPSAAAVCGINAIMSGLFSILVTCVLIGVCQNAKMPCRMGTLPAVVICSAFMMLAGILCAGAGAKEIRAEGGRR